MLSRKKKMLSTTKTPCTYETLPNNVFWKNLSFFLCRFYTFSIRKIIFSHWIFSVFVERWNYNRYWRMLWSRIENFNVFLSNVKESLDAILTEFVQSIWNFAYLSRTVDNAIFWKNNPDILIRALRIRDFH